VLFFSCFSSIFVVSKRVHKRSYKISPATLRNSAALHLSDLPFEAAWSSYHNVAWDEAYLGTNWHVDPSISLDKIDRGRKLDVCSFWGAGTQSNTHYTMLPGLRPTSVLSGILIQPGVWPQRTWAQNWGCAPLGGELGPHLTQCGLGRGLPPYQDMGRKLGVCLFWGSWVPI